MDTVSKYFFWLVPQVLHGWSVLPDLLEYTCINFTACAPPMYSVILEIIFVFHPDIMYCLSFTKISCATWISWSTCAIYCIYYTPALFVFLAIPVLHESVLLVLNEYLLPVIYVYLVLSVLYVYLMLPVLRPDIICLLPHVLPVLWTCIMFYLVPINICSTRVLCATSVLHLDICLTCASCIIEPNV